jgi:predicted hotdog family 3-hydroxylacyl-ACP dehydratase
MSQHQHLFEYLPHGQAMHLLDRIDSVESTTICCTVTSHQAQDHPMRYADRLGCACAVEMAAQAVAMHSAHLSMQSGNKPSEPAKGGMLTSVRDLKLHAERLDTYSQALCVRASLQAGDSMGALYSFSISTQEQGQELELLTGRMSVVNFVR